VRLGARIQAARKSRKLSQTGVGNLIGVAKQTVSQWERGISPPLISNLLRYAAVTEVSLSSLLEDLDSALDQNDQALVRARRSARTVPLFDPDQISQISGRIPKDSREYAASNFPHSSRAFAIRIKGSAMEPNFRSGDLAIVDPNLTPDPGTFVLAYCTSQVILRKYRPVQAGTTLAAQLVPLNSDWPISVMSEGDVIYGAVSEHISRG
jgi:transcriptional regulator with XRE-family HTH domain